MAEVASSRLEGTVKVDRSEVTAKAKRRSFSAEYKLRILREADALAASGGIGEMLRREGLYSSHLTSWRGERERGELAGLAEKKRGRKAKADQALVKENQRLARAVARLEKRLAQAETIIEVQKKVATLLGIPLKSPDGDGSSS
jgi:transposase-like protein